MKASVRCRSDTSTTREAFAIHEDPRVNNAHVQDAWIVVGLAALSSCALWAWLARRWSRPVLMPAALSIPAIGIALLGAARRCDARARRLRRAVRRHLHGRQYDRSVDRNPPSSSVCRSPVDRRIQRRPSPRPAVRAPLLSHGYHQALLLGSAMVVVAAVATAAVCPRFPHHLEPVTSAPWRPHPPGEVGQQAAVRSGRGRSGSRSAGGRRADVSPGVRRRRRGVRCRAAVSVRRRRATGPARRPRSGCRRLRRPGRAAARAPRA